MHVANGEYAVADAWALWKGNKMKINHLLVCLMMLVFIFSFDSSYADGDEIVKMINDLPHSDSLKKSFKIISEKEKDPFFRHDGELTEEGKKQQLESAYKDIETAKNIVPKLRDLIQIGKSIFDYPGLITKGPIRYDSDKKKYTIHIGVYLSNHEGQGNTDFILTFDERGIIERTDKVIYKH